MRCTAVFQESFKCAPHRCRLDMYHFATGDVIQIRDECLVWFFLNQCFKSHPEKRSGLWVKLAEANRSDETNDAKARPFVPRFWLEPWVSRRWIWSCGASLPPFSIPASPAARTAAAPPAVGRAGRAPSFPAVPHFPSLIALAHPPAPFHAQFFEVLVFVISCVDSKDILSLLGKRWVNLRTPWVLDNNNNANLLLLLVFDFESSQWRKKLWRQRQLRFLKWFYSKLKRVTWCILKFFLFRNENTTYKSAQNKKENKWDFLIDNTCKKDRVIHNALRYFFFILLLLWIWD